jgi:hypothetical protein
VHDKDALRDYLIDNPAWTVYTLASHMGVKARDIYTKLDEHTRLMLILEGRMLAKHVLEGLYDEPEPKPLKRKAKPSLASILAEAFK